MTPYEAMNESISYQVQKDIIKREINWGAEAYAANQLYFKKDKVEKSILYNLKHQFREKMRRKDSSWTRRSSGKKKFLELHYKYTF